MIKDNPSDILVILVSSSDQADVVTSNWADVLPLDGDFTDSSDRKKIAMMLHHLPPVLHCRVKTLFQCCRSASSMSSKCEINRSKSKSIHGFDLIVLLQITSELRSFAAKSCFPHGRAGNCLVESVLSRSSFLGTHGHAQE